MLADELSACRSLGATVFLNGGIAGQSSEYRITLTAWRCRDGKRLESETTPAHSRVDVLPALDRAAVQMRRRLGEPDSSLEKNTAPLTQATTGSLLALKSLTMGDEKFEHGQVTQSIADYRLAIDLDPQFALAYARLGKAYMNARQYTDAKTSIQRAFELKDRTTDRERLYIAAQYYSYGTGELP